MFQHLLKENALFSGFNNEHTNFEIECVLIFRMAKLFILYINNNQLKIVNLKETAPN